MTGPRKLGTRLALNRNALRLARTDGCVSRTISLTIATCCDASLLRLTDSRRSAVALVDLMLRRIGVELLAATKLGLASSTAAVSLN